MIRLEHLVKHYGPVKAVDDISFTVNQGEILGLLGPNGAGKSTTLKMVTGFLTPTGGEITVGEHNIRTHSREIRKMLGYLAENNPLYLEMTVHEFLTFVSQIREIPEDKINANLKRVVERTGLKPMITRPIGTLSKGYRQRVGLAQAILHNPEVLILDEPTLGLDPNQNVEIRELIKEHGRDKTLIVSSHDLQLIGAVCDRIVIISHGHIVANGTPAELTAEFSGTGKLRVVLNAPAQDVHKLEVLVPGIRIVSRKPLENDLLELEMEYPTAVDPRTALVKTVADQGWQLLEIVREAFGLPDLFRKLTLEDADPILLQNSDESITEEPEVAKDEAAASEQSEEKTPAEDESTSGGDR